MCPSYLGTLEEEHSTRGRAHMLFEMLQGEIVNGGWEDENVKKSLDLCLSCKACKTECPANVDVATYKAEFLSHYYERKRRPLHAYAFGMIDRWARLASFTPRLANWAPTAPLVGQFMRKGLGLARERQLPHFANHTFRQWARKCELGSLQQASALVRRGAKSRPGCSLGRHIQQLLPSSNSSSCGGGAFTSRLSSTGSATASLLRPPDVRLWHAGSREKVSARNPSSAWRRN